MEQKDDILELLKQKSAESVRNSQFGLVLQPGAIGDCLLTLPLIRFMKEQVRLAGVDVIGHTDYIGLFPARTCVDRIRSIDIIDLHKLFFKPKSFDLADADPLISVFKGYSWIVSFLGGAHSNFEKNLVFTVNCSQGADVITLPLKPPKNTLAHVADYYIEQFVEQCGLKVELQSAANYKNLAKATDSDKITGRELLKQSAVKLDRRTIVIHPGSGGRSKCWHMDNYIAIADELKQDNSVIFLLGPAEIERFDAAALTRMQNTGKCLQDLTLPQVLAVLSCADVFIGNDSGITHLSAQLGVNTVALFGPTDPGIYGPLGPEVTILRGPKTTFSRKASRKLQRQLLEAIDL
ncbi:MAG: glycosyltransferase family 9 protein [Planctomycetota bacterium]|jgi:ADP-heptose:LPS heptosyltransferase